MSAKEITLWLGATRYYLGRRTYAVSDFCELLIENWGSLEEKTKNLLIRDIEQEFEDDDRARLEGRDYKPLGDNCDRESWEKVRNLWKK